MIRLILLQIGRYQQPLPVMGTNRPANLWPLIPAVVAARRQGNPEKVGRGREGMDGKHGWAERIWEGLAHGTCHKDHLKIPYIILAYRKHNSKLIIYYVFTNLSFQQSIENIRIEACFEFSGSLTSHNNNNMLCASCTICINPLVRLGLLGFKLVRSVRSFNLKIKSKF